MNTSPFESPIMKSPGKVPKLSLTGMFGGNKFHSGASVYNYSSNKINNKSIGLSPVKSVSAAHQFNKDTIRTMHQRDEDKEFQMNMRKTV